MRSILLLGRMALVTAIAITFAGCSDKGHDNPTGGNNTPVLMPTWRGNDGIGQFLAQKCAPCHTTQNQSGFTVTSHASIMQGEERIRPGDANGSYMIQKLEPNPPGSRMPQGGPYLTTAEIDTIKVWINAGAQDN